MKVTGYKLTDAYGSTRNNTQWGPGVTHVAPGGEPYTSDVVHWYPHPLIAVLVDPIHGKYDKYGKAQLWTCEGIQTGTDGLKCWGTTSTTIEQISKPIITIPQRVRWGIYIVQELGSFQDWHDWAASWLSGSDRSYKAAQAAVKAVEAESVDTAAWAAARAAGASVWSACASEWSVTAAEAAWYVALAADRAAESDVNTARLIELAQRAIRDEP